LNYKKMEEALNKCIKAIEWSHRSADGKYHPVFDEFFLKYLKEIAEETMVPTINPDQKVVLYPPTIDWSWMFQRPQHILSQFAANGWKVLYANKTQKKGVPPTIVAPNIEVHHDWGQLLHSVSKMQIDVLWISWAYHHNVKVNAKVVVYDCLDDFEEWDKYEKSILERSNIVFTSSQALFDKQKTKHPNVVMVRNACDPAAIGSRTYPIPNELIGLKRPIVGFVGALGQWVDDRLLEKIAQSYSLVIIGPKLGKNPPARARYLGMKNYTQLPCYYGNIDVGIIPFSINRVSVAANPVKMYEYLAAGKPVVTTDLPECHNHDGLVFPCKDISQFLQSIEKANSIPGIASKARAVALENTWEIRFRTIQEEINKLL
jgi:teichuronic acid biosynthesis glycosyltransferase TuaH